MNIAKHPIDDLTIGDGFRLWEATGISKEDARFVMRYPRIHTLTTMMKVLSAQDVEKILNKTFEPLSDDPTILEDFEAVLSDTQYRLSREPGSDPDYETIRLKAIEKFQQEMADTGANKYSHLVGCLAWLWMRKDNKDITLEAYLDTVTETDAISYLEDMFQAWDEANPRDDEDEQSPRVPLDSTNDPKSPSL